MSDPTAPEGYIVSPIEVDGEIVEAHHEYPDNNIVEKEAYEKLQEEMKGKPKKSAAKKKEKE